RLPDRLGVGSGGLLDDRPRQPHAQVAAEDRSRLQGGLRAGTLARPSPRGHRPAARCGPTVLGLPVVGRPARVAGEAQAALPVSLAAGGGEAAGGGLSVRSPLRVIVTGLIAQHPLLGGMTWHYLQYVLGLARLGHDVYYLEDSGEWPYN